MSYLLQILIEAKDDASKVLGGVGDALTGVGKVGLAVAGAGLAALGGALYEAVSSASESQDVFAQTAAVVKSTGGAAGLSAEQMADLASSLSAAAGKSKFGDEMILQGENVLATFTNIGKDVFPAATQASLDMAQAMHKTPEAMSMLLGKALSSAEGVSALRKMGVQFNDTQLETIKHLFATGHAAEAQKLILAELGNEFGGSAAAAAQTFSGQLGTLKDKFGELLEGIGTKLLPILTQFVGYLNSPEVQVGIQAFADALVNGIGQAATAIGPILAQLGPILQGAFQVFTTEILPVLLGLWQQLETGLANAQPLFTTAAAAVQPLIATFTDAKNPVQGLINVLAQISPTFALVKAALDAALPPIQTIIMTVFGIISGFLSQHGAQIKTDVAGAWQTIQAIINGVIPPIQLIISTIFGAIAAFLQAHGAEIQAVLALAWDTIALIVQTALDLIQATIVPALAAIAGFLSSHSAQIQSVLNLAWTAIKSIITIALSLIQGIIKTATALIKGDWSGAWTAIQTTAATIWTALKALFTANLTFISTLWKTIWDAVYRLFQGYLDSIVSWASQTFHALVGAIAGLAGSASAAAGWVGSAIVSGITSGIEHGASAIISAAKRAAMAALDAAKHALGISSPSKLFRAEIGQNIGAGLALGITDTIPNVTRATTRMAEASAQGARSTTTNYTLNYQGVHQQETDVRAALRTQALLMGAV